MIKFYLNPDPYLLGEHLYMIDVPTNPHLSVGIFLVGSTGIIRIINWPPC